MGVTWLAPRPQKTPLSPLPLPGTKSRPNQKQSKRPIALQPLHGTKSSREAETSGAVAEEEEDDGGHGFEMHGQEEDAVRVVHMGGSYLLAMLLRQL